MCVEICDEILRIDEKCVQAYIIKAQVYQNQEIYMIAIQVYKLAR